MTQMAGTELIKRVEYVERKSGLFQVQKHREKGSRDKRGGGKHKPQKESENHLPDKRIDITV